MNLFLFTSLAAGLVACVAPVGETDSDVAEDDFGDEIDAIDVDAVAPIGRTPDGDSPSELGPREAAPPVLDDNGIGQLEAPSPQFDACGGALIDVSDGIDLSFTATTTGGQDDFKTFCGDVNSATAAADVVYKLVLSEDCTLDLTLTDSSELFDPVLELRRVSCEAEVGGDHCANQSGNVENLRIHATAGTYWAVIDGSSAGSAGDFTFRVQCDAPACGDGVVNPGEDCDDGNADNNDGCSSACTVEATTAANTCEALDPGQPISLGAGTVSLPGASANFANAGASVTDDYIGTCAWETGGLDQVFDIVPTIDGTLTVKIGFDANGDAICQPPDWDQLACIDHTLFVREADCNGTNEIACQQSDAADLTNVIEVPVLAGTHYYVFVDGYNGESYSSGLYGLELSLTP